MSVHNKAVVCILNTINKAGPTGPCFVAPGLLFSSVVRDLGKLQLAQNRAARLAFKVVEERLTSLLVFVRGVDKLKGLSCMIKIPMHTPQDMPPEVSSQSKSRTDYGRSTVLHRAMTIWNYIPQQVTDARSRIRFKKKVKIQLMEHWGLK